MPTIKLKIDDENLVRQAKNLAAKRGLTLSQMFADYLEQEIRQENEYDTAKAEALSFLGKGLRMGGKPLTRDEVHNRNLAPAPQTAEAPDFVAKAQKVWGQTPGGIPLSKVSSDSRGKR